MKIFTQTANLKELFSDHSYPPLDSPINSVLMLALSHSYPSVYSWFFKLSCSNRYLFWCAFLLILHVQTHVTTMIAPIPSAGVGPRGWVPLCDCLSSCLKKHRSHSGESGSAGVPGGRCSQRCGAGRGAEAPRCSASPVCTASPPSSAPSVPDPPVSHIPLFLPPRPSLSTLALLSPDGQFRTQRGERRREQLVTREQGTNVGFVAL